MGIDRRNFLKLLGVSATAPLASCASGPVEKIIPYVIQPEDIVPGVSVHYATVCQECSAGCGMLVRTREGRAVKVEGNPSHPVNAGSLCARGQASLQGLYNPDRIRQPLARDDAGRLQPISWEESEQIVADKLQTLRTQDQAQAQAQAQTNTITFLTGQLADSLHRLVEEWLGVFDSQQYVTYEPFAYESLRQASLVCFGQASLPSYAIDQAEFVISFGADFLETWRSPVEYARAFSKMRAGEVSSTFVQVEPRQSLTGANADTWVSIKPGTEAFLALGMARLIVTEGHASNLSAEETEKLSSLLEPYSPERVAALTDVPTWRIQSLARDFVRQRPSVAIGGGVAASSREGTASHIAVHVLNYVAGNIGHTVLFEARSDLDDLHRAQKVAPYSRLLALIETMERGEVALLLLAHTNPVFTAPQASRFLQALEKVPFIVSFSSFLDETTERAHLVLPDHTPLESWGDNSPRPGVHGLMQPVMTPVFDTKAMGDVLISIATRVYAGAAPTGQTEQTGQAEQKDGQAEQKETPLKPLPSWDSFFTCLQDSWRTIHKQHVQTYGAAIDFETFWHDALQHGGYWNETQPTTVQLSPAVYEQTFAEPTLSGPEQFSIPLMLYPSSRYFDGRGANKPWLQELPDPITNAVWDSWVEIHPDTAARLGITDGDVLILTSEHGMLQAPAYLYANMQPDMLAMPIGQGHTAYGQYAQGRGANPIQLLPAESEHASGGLPWFSTRVQIAQAGRREPLVTTAGSHRQLGRGMAQSVTAATLAEQHNKAHAETGHAGHDMYPELEYEQYRWGMSIDLSACTGCGACVTACYAENNIPVVGKEMVAQGREMAWLRIERYFADESPQHWDPEMPAVSFSPMLCQQCGNAPCEPVCPVYATYHNPEGLNAQVYNRCVGTRYCSNNCPYKVRRFNWSQAEWPEPLQLQLNPDVTVREAGVMEKCTFCVQRIQEGKDRAKDEERPVRDGEITPACAQTCPTQAITFGNREDPDSAVSQQSHSPRAYKVLEELNTKPAVTYLKRVVRREKA